MSESNLIRLLGPSESEPDVNLANFLLGFEDPNKDYDRSADKFAVINGTYKKPNRLQVKTLMFDKQGKKLLLKYGKGLKRKSPLDYVPDFKEYRAYLSNFRNSSFKHQSNLGRHPANTGGPLSINAEESTLVIMTLPENGNLQFNSLGAPFSAPSSVVGRFGATGKIKADGGIVFSSVIFPPANTSVTFEDDCKAAFFVVDAAPKEGFRFNIHLDITRDLDGQKYRIPIIVDPDVRHPGGSLNT